MALLTNSGWSSAASVDSMKSCDKRDSFSVHTGAISWQKWCALEHTALGNRSEKDKELACSAADLVMLAILQD